MDRLQFEDNISCILLVALGSTVGFICELNRVEVKQKLLPILLLE